MKTVIPEYADRQSSRWRKPGRGKWYKRQYNKACRRAAKGAGKTKSVARWASELDYKGT